MNRVNAELRISETSLLKRKNCLLWVLVAILTAFLIYSESRIERIKAQVNPQAVMDACTRSIK